MSDTDHMRNIGVNHVDDMMQVNCRNDDRSSSDIRIDKFDQESVIYNLDDWSQGVLVRKEGNVPQGITQSFSLLFRLLS